MKFKILPAIAFTLLIFSSCQKDEGTVGSSSNLDNQLAQILKDATNGEGAVHFTLPYSTEVSKIPQDPNNPITPEKVQLGALLFHETGLAVNPMHTENEGNYSCASCHFASAGFQAGRHQAISDGGIGFGNNGEGRMPNPLYDLTELDVQPVRSPAALNSAYQKVNLWNGQFGATGPNTGTEVLWEDGTPIATNHLGYEGVENTGNCCLGRSPHGHG